MIVKLFLRHHDRDLKENLMESSLVALLIFIRMGSYSLILFSTTFLCPEKPFIPSPLLIISVFQLF